MPSVGERKALKRSKTAARAADVAVQRQAEADGIVARGSAAPDEPPPVRVRKISGLKFLAGRGRITAMQLAAGERYGQAFRLAGELTGPPIKSSLAEPERVGGGGGAAMYAATDYAQERRILAARAELQRVRLLILQNHSGLVAVLDAICGKELAPGEVTPVQREQESIVTGLQIALDLVAGFYARLDKSS